MHMMCVSAQLRGPELLRAISPRQAANTPRVWQGLGISGGFDLSSPESRDKILDLHFRISHCWLFRWLVCQLMKNTPHCKQAQITEALWRWRAAAGEAARDAARAAVAQQQQAQARIRNQKCPILQLCQANARPDLCLLVCAGFRLSMQRPSPEIVAAELFTSLSLSMPLRLLTRLSLPVTFAGRSGRRSGSSGRRGRSRARSIPEAPVAVDGSAAAALQRRACLAHLAWPQLQLSWFVPLLALCAFQRGVGASAAPLRPSSAVTAMLCCGPQCS